MADADVDIKISADASGAQTGFKQSQDAAQAAASAINKSFEGLGKVFDQVREHLGAITAILAGGAAFKEAISVTKEWGGEQASLAKQLQITTLQAAAYQIVGEEIGVTGETLVSASDKLTKQLLKNEDAFAKVGIETRNSNGSYRSTGELMPEVVEHLRGLHNATEQNTQGMAFFGKAWVEVRGILKLSKEALAEAAEKAKELNLVVDPAELKAYKAAMSDVGLIMKSMEIQVGNMLLPLLTKLGTWMGEVGPYVCGTFSIALRAIGEVGAFVYRSIEAVVEIFAGFAAVMIEFIQGNYKNAWNMAVDAANQSADKIKKIFTGIGDVWNAKTKVKGGLQEDDQGHTDLTPPKEKKDSTLMAQYEAQLAMVKLSIDQSNAAYGTYYTLSKAAESAFWANKLATVDRASKEYPQILKKSIDAQLAASKEGFDGQLAMLAREEEAARFDFDKKIALAQQEVAMLRQHYLETSKEVQAGLEKVEKLKQQKAEQSIKIAETQAQAERDAALGIIALQEQQAQIEVALMQKTDAQLLADLQTFENQRYAIALAAFEERKALVEKEGNREEIAKLDGQKLQLQQQHNQKMMALQGQAAVQQNALAKSLFGTLQTGFASVISGAMQGTLKMRDVLKQAYSSIADALSQAVAKMVADWLLGEVRKKAATLEASFAQLQAAAAAAAGNAYNAMVGVPYIGPVLGPAAAAVAYAGVMAFGADVSAEGGYDIPGGVNPVVQAHPREMILPAPVADTVRNAMGNGGGGGDVHHHYNVTVNGPQDKRSMERWMADLLPGATNRSQRNFGLAK